MSNEAGPRSLGPWLVWRALHSEPATQALTLPIVELPPAAVVPRGLCGDRGGNTGEPPSSGSTGRLILDLCGGSGAWSRPYAAAGYRVIIVTLPETDVRTYVPPPDVWGVLAAPPCDQFSIARNGHKAPRDFTAALEIVAACIRIVAACRPRWWALENPVGLLSRFLGTPTDSWEPCDFGDPWTKRTAIWGDFQIPERGPYVKPLGGGPFCEVCDPSRRKTRWCSNSGHRAITPPGFAGAFFRANP